MRVLLLAAILTGCSGIELAPPPISIDGRRVVYEENYAIGGHGAATWIGGEPYIFVHPDLFYELSNDMQWWVLGHELGHLEHPGISETGADCAGVRWMSAIGALSDSTVAAITDAVSEYHASDVHPDGALRSINIFACVTGLDLLWRD